MLPHRREELEVTGDLDYVQGSILDASFLYAKDTIISRRGGQAQTQAAEDTSRRS